ncbi:hypothetical protein Poli38472_007856 [Pythium oligandrum]|uniref:Hexose transporter 1 n=1 Tax=Pythium oligandrum TaxID=41045 RepID=A0A8K1CRC5_PYTOL|nr:hypothetical protein Poli38472_007856 [Pythium oligandrum]|eukprot:TMW68184.1 hypothetical protein Poli38472_007856 [Pythium oligandrum]
MALPLSPSPAIPSFYVPVVTPKAQETPTTIRVNALVYTSAALALLQSAQFGWSLSQLNLSTFNDKDDCDSRPVAAGTCLMFPGHSKTEWTLAVNAWTVGGIVGSLICGSLSDAFGRRRTWFVSCALMIAGATIQAASMSLPVFVVGRFVAGLASGFATAMCNGYINDVAPPHLRSMLGSCYGLSTATGIVLVGVSFFFANTASGWRYIAGFPIVIAGVFLLLAPRYLAESPSWLLAKGRREEAEAEIARLFGWENAATALTWMETTPTTTADESSTSKPSERSTAELESHAQRSSPPPWKALISTKYRRQTLLALSMSVALQFSGINVVFFYSSSMFKDAGVEDDRVGSLIVNMVNLLPSFVVGVLARRFGNRKMIIAGQVGMLLSAVGLTIALLINVQALSIVFMSTYVAGFSLSLGPLAFAVASDLFPDALRANGIALTLFVNWCGTFVIGVGYPYIADVLDDLAFLPFIAVLSFFVFFMTKKLPETSGKTSVEIQGLFQH